MSTARNLANAASTVAAAKNGLTWKFWVIGILVALVAIIFISPLAAIPGEDTAAADPCGETSAPGDAAPPADASARAEQVSLAKTADNVATTMNLPGRAVLVIIMTGYQESGMKNIDYGDRDSLGWLQQRPTQGWGTPTEVMDPVHSSTRFFEALQRVDSWPQMSFNDAAQTVQRSGFPLAYAKHEAAARKLASESGIDLTREGDPYGGRYGPYIPAPESGADPCAAPPGPNPDGTWPADSATVCPDPTRGKGCITPRTAAIVAAMPIGIANGVSCWDAHAWNPTSDHATGRACDIGYGPGFSTSPKLESGHALAAWMIQNAGTYGVKYIIWQGKIWYAKKGAWQPYTSSIYDVTSASGGHYDHVHVSMF